MNNFSKLFAASTIVALSIGFFQGVEAANDTDLNITISDGTLDVDIRTQEGIAVASPLITMDAITSSFTDATSTGVFGEDDEGEDQRIVAFNPRDDEVFSVTINGTYADNDSWYGLIDHGATCPAGLDNAVVWTAANGGDDRCYYVMDYAAAETAGNGYLKINPQSGSIEEITPNPAKNIAAGGANCAEDLPSPGDTPCFVSPLTEVTDLEAANITLGPDFKFDGTTPAALFSATSGANDYTIFSLIGVGLSQNVPAQQPADSYLINLTLDIS